MTSRFARARAAVAVALAVTAFVAAPAGAQLTPGPARVLDPDRPADALVRFAPPHSPERWQRGGVEVARAEGRVLSYAGWVVLRGTRRALLDVARDPAIAELRMMPPQGILPLDRTMGRIGLPNARGAGSPASEWTGAGVRIADLDSHVDVFHPDFFRGDAGWYDWIDDNGDGRFTVGEDAIDLNGDGVPQAEERARVLRASLVDFGGASTADLTRRGFDPAVDWLYLDVNDNRERDFGADGGFTDADPALGEPIFVADDVDGDGTLDPEERVVRLGTSKFEAVYVVVDRPGIPPHDAVYRRGVDLAWSPGDVTGGIFGYNDTLHASGVFGILAGGVPLPSRRFVGVAPDAELLGASEIGRDGGRLAWALMQSPDILLHEYVSWTNVHLDGGDAASMMIDASSAAGVVNICPAGNIGGAGKHAQTSVAAGNTEVLTFDLDSRIQQAQLSVYVRGAGGVVTLVSPDGTRVPLVVGEDYRPTPSGEVYVFGESSPRGTISHHASIYMPTTPAGWSAEVQAGGAPLEVHGMLADEAGFSASSSWRSPTDRSTLAWPATADSCIAVGSTPGHLASEGPFYVAGNEAAGEVRAYSARGPRIDGDLRPHVLAPDNPWSASGHGEVLPSMPGFGVLEHGSYRVFGGTSGAGPHVAGIAALLLQTGLTGEEVVGRLTSTAIADPIAGAVPNDDYGFGRVHAGAALGGPVDGAPPAVTFTISPPEVRPGATAMATIDAPTAVEVRWDDDYDGEWDTAYEPLGDRELHVMELGTYRMKVRVRDAEGRFSEAAAMLVVTNEPSVPDGGPTAGDAGVDGGTDDPMDGGCGCSTPGRSRTPWSLAVGLLGLLGLLVRRCR